MTDNNNLNQNGSFNGSNSSQISGGGGIGQMNYQMKYGTQMQFQFTQNQQNFSPQNYSGQYILHQTNMMHMNYNAMNQYTARNDISGSKNTKKNKIKQPKYMQTVGHTQNQQNIHQINMQQQFSTPVQPQSSSSLSNQPMPMGMPMTPMAAPIQSSSVASHPISPKQPNQFAQIQGNRTSYPLGQQRKKHIDIDVLSTKLRELDKSMLGVLFQMFRTIQQKGLSPEDVCEYIIKEFMNNPDDFHLFNNILNDASNTRFVQRVPDHYSYDRTHPPIFIRIAFLNEKPNLIPAKCPTEKPCILSIYPKELYDIHHLFVDDREIPPIRLDKDCLCYDLTGKYNEKSKFHFKLDTAQKYAWCTFIRCNSKTDDEILNALKEKYGDKIRSNTLFKTPKCPDSCHYSFQQAIDIQRKCGKFVCESCKKECSISDLVPLELTEIPTKVTPINLFKARMIKKLIDIRIRPYSETIENEILSEDSSFKMLDDSTSYVSYTNSLLQ